MYDSICFMLITKFNVYKVEIKIKKFAKINGHEIIIIDLTFSSTIHPMHSARIFVHRNVVDIFEIIS